MSTITLKNKPAGLGGFVAGQGPSLPPAKTRKGVTVETATPVEAVEYKPKAVLAEAVARAEAKRAEIGRAVKPTIANAKTHKEAGEAAVAAAAEFKPEAVEPAKPEEAPIVQALQAAANAGCLKELVNAVWPSEPQPVSDSELKEALAIIARASKQQAEAIRKAAAERKKVAPEGAKVVKEKELTQAQKAKLAKDAELAATYSITCSAAMGFVGKGLTESKSMQIALSVLNLPALRWLAKQYEGVSIPKDKRSALDIREFLRIELLTWKPKAEVKA